MGRKIFVSYKYADNRVANLAGQKDSTARDYVTEFQNILDKSDHIYKGEGEDEDLSQLSDDTIWEKLKDRIYDSSLTIIFLSPGMKETGKEERDQWIPWEVSYSLKEVSRRNSSGNAVSSKTNAMIAVVLPDENSSYAYYLENKSCCSSHCRAHHTNSLFEIIRKNKFNLKNATKKACDSGSTIWYGDCSYIAAVTWEDFKEDCDKYIDEAYARQENIDNYTIHKEI